MFERTAVRAIVVGLLAWAAPLSGQSTAQATEEATQQSEAELLRRIDALRVGLDAATDAMTELTRRQASEAAAARRALTTTLEIGPLRVMALHDQADLAAELFESVWREDFHAISGSPSLARSIFAFEWWQRQPAEVYVVAMTDARGLVVRRIEVARSWVSTRAGLRSHVRDAIWAALREDFALGSPMRSWLGEARYVSYEDAYRSLAMTGTGASRSCLAGNLQACSTTLWLLAAGPGRLAEWFTPRQRENMVRRAAQPWSARAEREDPEVIACIERDETASCDAVLARIGWSEGVPTSPEVLVSALWHAVRVGGEGAWERVLQQPGSSPPEVLERASGRSTESLLAEWRTFLMGRRPSVYAGLGRSALAASFWILILAGFAMRSTRWRLA